MSKPQQTIKQAISYQGIGLHSGEPVNMVLNLHLKIQELCLSARTLKVILLCEHTLIM